LKNKKKKTERKTGGKEEYTYGERRVVSGGVDEQLSRINISLIIKEGNCG